MSGAGNATSSYGEPGQARSGNVGRLRLQNLRKKKKAQWATMPAPSSSYESCDSQSSQQASSSSSSSHAHHNQPAVNSSYLPYSMMPSSPQQWWNGLPMSHHQHHNNHNHNSHTSHNHSQHHAPQWHAHQHQQHPVQWHPQQLQWFNQHQQAHPHQHHQGHPHALHALPLVMSPTNNGGSHMMIPQPTSLSSPLYGSNNQTPFPSMQSASSSQQPAMASSMASVGSSSVNTSSTGDLTPSSTPGSEPLPKISSPSMLCLAAPEAAKIDEPVEADKPQTLFHQSLKSVNRIKGTKVMPTSRFGHTAVVHGDVMVIFGGRDGRCNDDLWTYNFVEKKWTHLNANAPKGQTDRPKARAGHTAVVMDGKMLMFGGVAESPAGMHSCWLNDLWSLDLTTFKWSLQRSKGGRLPCGRKGHTAVTHKQSMFVFGGGQDDMSLNSDLWEYNSQLRKWIPRRYTGYHPKERMYHVAAVNKDSMIAFGGRAAVKTGFLNDIFEINLHDFVCRSLKTTGPAPTQRMCSTAVCFNGVFSVFTGGSLSYLDDSYQLDLRKSEWSPIENISCGGRTRPTTVRWRNTLLTFGGCVNGGYVNDCIEVELEPRSLASCAKQFILNNHIPYRPQDMPQSVLEFMRK
eukprot:TRINITY_DN24810_c0_g1_i1.p1 TRINITY_DN24810_c0_g1~~TRINITY_DN24810_c0_g1_i1.p1  ORF type:complete len:628 (+),score=216.51 TRINITY_DN24810_c0_g1_i1:167-2050(+)